MPWQTIAAEAEHESPLWGEALRAEAEPEPVFSTLADERYALGLETIYEGYLVHYGTARLFAAEDPDVALLLGDYLYAHGLVRIAELGDVEAIRELAALISRCAHLRAEGAPGDGEAWAETAERLGGGVADRSAREERTLRARPARRIDSRAVSTLAAAILPLFEGADAAEEGLKVITAMLIVGLVFIGVIVVGELTRYVIERRRD